MRKLFNSKFLLSPWMIIFGIFAGALIGLSNKTLANQLSQYGQVYLNLIQMCVLPIVITAIISSLGNLLHSDLTSDCLKKVIIVFAVGLIAVSLFSIVAGLLDKPGVGLDRQSQLILSQQVSHTESNVPIPTIATNIISFLENSIPTNIFAAMDQNNILEVLVFCVVLGIALGLTKTTGSKQILALLDTIYAAFLKIISWVMYILPLGLCFLFAGYLAKINMNEVNALGKLLILFYLTMALLTGIYSIIIWRYCKIPYLQGIRALKAPLLIGFTTSSSFAAIPAMLESLQLNLKLDKRITDLIVPLGININRHGSVLRLVLVAIFTAQLYGQTLSFEQLVILFVTAILAGIAASGVPGIASVGVLALILQPLGLPSTVGIIILITIVPFIDAALTLINVYGNCASAALIVKQKNK